MGTKRWSWRAPRSPPADSDVQPVLAHIDGLHTWHSTTCTTSRCSGSTSITRHRRRPPALATDRRSCLADGKTLTLTHPVRREWSDGKPFSAADFAFTFTCWRRHRRWRQRHPGARPAPPRPALTTPSSSSSRSLEAGNMFNIGTQAIVSQHVWQGVSDPSTYQERDPGRHRALLLDKFTPAGHPAQGEPGLLNKSAIHVPGGRLPRPTPAQTRRSSGPYLGPDRWAGNFITNVQSVFVGLDPAHNHVWLPETRRTLTRTTW